MIWVRGPGAATTKLLATQAIGSRTATLLAASGVLEHYPLLHVVFVEVNTSWPAWTMHTADEYYRAHASWSAPKLAELPSRYMRRELHATFQRDPVGIANRAMTGVDCLLWGGDYPHPETTYPHSVQVLGTLFDGVDDADVTPIVGGTAARLFGLDLAANRRRRSRPVHREPSPQRLHESGSPSPRRAGATVTSRPRATFPGWSRCRPMPRR